MQQGGGSQELYEKIRRIAEERGVTPCQALYAVTLAALADAHILNQATVNFLASHAAPRLHAYLKAKGLLRSEGSTTLARLENLLRSLNEALGIGPRVEARKIGDDVYELGLGGERCRYCPRGVGLAEIPWAACPFPKLVESIARLEGIQAEALPVETPKGRSLIMRRGDLCWIRLHVAEPSH